jgi:hypothetical protein
MHVAGLSHVLPHEPQFESSVVVSVQRALAPSPQSVPLAHWHCPKRHVEPVPQALPQVPQWAESV